MRSRPEFNFDRPFTVSVVGGLVWRGQRYPQGARFPWRDLCLAESDLWELWALGQVDNVPPETVATAVPSAASASKAAALPSSPPRPVPPPAQPQRGQQPPPRQQHPNNRHNQHRR